MRRRFLLTKVAGSVNVAKMISRIHRAQGKIRTELKDPAQWMKYGYYKNVDVSYATAAHYDKVPRVDGRNLTHEQFCEVRYVDRYISGLRLLDSNPAVQQ